ncbi:unnamed protein product, partial [Allacma fusca]
APRSRTTTPASTPTSVAPRSRTTTPASTPTSVAPRSKTTTPSVTPWTPPSETRRISPQMPRGYSRDLVFNKLEDIIARYSTEERPLKLETLLGFGVVSKALRDALIQSDKVTETHDQCRRRHVQNEDDGSDEIDYEQPSPPIESDLDRSMRIYPVDYVDHREGVNNMPSDHEDEVYTSASDSESTSGDNNALAETYTSTEETEETEVVETAADRCERITGGKRSFQGIKNALNTMLYTAANDIIEKQGRVLTMDNLIDSFEMAFMASTNRTRPVNEIAPREHLFNDAARLTEMYHSTEEARESNKTFKSYLPLDHPHKFNDMYCALCLKLFTNKTAWNHHFVEQHVNRAVRFECLLPDCKRKFQAKWRIQVHLEKDHDGAELVVEPGETRPPSKVWALRAVKTVHDLNDMVINKVPVPSQLRHKVVRGMKRKAKTPPPEPVRMETDDEPQPSTSAGGKRRGKVTLPTKKRKK